MKVFLKHRLLIFCLHINFHDLLLENVQENQSRVCRRKVAFKQEKVSRKNRDRGQLNNDSRVFLT